MNIGEAAARSELPAKTIRYYEDIALVRPARAANGYRDYSEEDVHRLRFVQRARGLGFTIEECRALLSLYDNEQRASADVKRVAQEKIREVERKIAELQSMRATLSRLVECCHGDDRPDCPILDDLAR
ncbi:MAG: Cu(I)-responsive transcriptional regulator [Stappia sp.]|uniref:Cu(I)-responsive transcriptional regulator n=1 Tax=Stappia sp. TaxID=1870903 RepID=UPI000C4C5CA3|nr:Cu(I)-responsive transcriptional regulator [Stappia sp.]MAB00028.1 Cu(I)-responsive transcriptional regulator [Stappia sp.]MBM22181.1 Cu(I)-responsive transcriptional regulator [Stappia sp.]